MPTAVTHNDAAAGTVAPAIDDINAHLLDALVEHKVKSAIQCLLQPTPLPPDSPPHPIVDLSKRNSGQSRSPPPPPEITLNDCIGDFTNDCCRLEAARLLRICLLRNKKKTHADTLAAAARKLCIPENSLVVLLHATKTYTFLSEMAADVEGVANPVLPPRPASK